MIHHLPWRSVLRMPSGFKGDKVIFTSTTWKLGTVLAIFMLNQFLMSVQYVKMDKDATVIDRLSHENTSTSTMSCKSQYSLPENYNPADHPPVKMRNHNCSDMSETQRKRRSRNRLSNRRSTGYVTGDVLEEALKMGPNSKDEEPKRQQ